MKELDRISKSLSMEIEEQLTRIGLLFRIYSRYKTKESIDEKIIRKSYNNSGKRLQDSIGIRVNLYFYDDLNIVIGLIQDLYEKVGEEIDQHNDETFRPTRINLVFKIPEKFWDEFSLATRGKEKIIDNTFEIQIRTILSEGWHEVEHDLRYKCRTDWENHKDLSRTLNGLYASLEVGEWGMLNIFNQLSYRNYKNKSWEAMLRNKFRLRFKKKSLSTELILILTENVDLAKEIYRLNRRGILERIINSKLYLPLTFDNIIYLLNYLYLRNYFITQLTPEFILEELNSTFNLNIKKTTNLIAN